MPRHYLVTGGAGFIGSNYVHRLLARGERVTVYDNLSRSGAPHNIQWLRQTFGEAAFRLVVGDVRDATLLTATVRDACDEASGSGNTLVIVHLASQVAVTTSVQRPREDFEINAGGTFNLLEAARLSGAKPIVLYASTNKVYGSMESVPLLEDETRYRYTDLPFGIPETQPLDFHSPYGCSKGTGDQYVRDYARIYDLPTVVFRQSCIYGTRQFGIEDQGWMAWFVIAAITGRQISIFGDGKQVRDMLFVDDLLDAYDAAVANIGAAAGRVYNAGGGPQNAISIWRETGPLLERLLGRSIPVTWHSAWRPGDQRICIMDTRKAQRELGWQPKIGVEEGVRRLVEWVKANRAFFA